MSEHDAATLQAQIDDEVRRTWLSPRYCIVLDRGSDVTDLTQCMDLEVREVHGGPNALGITVVSISFLESVLRAEPEEGRPAYFASPRFVIVLRAVSAADSVRAVADFACSQQLLPR